MSECFSCHLFKCHWGRVSKRWGTPRVLPFFPHPLSRAHRPSPPQSGRPGVRACRVRTGREPRLLTAWFAKRVVVVGGWLSGAPPARFLGSPPRQATECSVSRGSQDYKRLLVPEASF